MEVIMDRTERITQAAKDEVRSLIEEGRVPSEVRSFSELHDYIDANMLDAFDGLRVSSDDDMAVMNAAMDAVNEWLVTGRANASATRQQRWEALWDYIARHHPTLDLSRLISRKATPGLEGIAVTNGDDRIEVWVAEDGWRFSSAPRSPRVTYPNGNPIPPAYVADVGMWVIGAVFPDSRYQNLPTSGEDA